jgi:DNA-binding response OmpR family regulator
MAVAAPPSRVLLVDGHPFVLGRLKAGLERSGAVCFQAVDCAEALRAFYVERPHVIVLSLRLICGNGWDLLTTIRAMSDVPVLLISSDDSRVEKFRGLRSQADGFVEQPLDEEELAVRVEVLLRKDVNFEDSEPPLEDEFIALDRLRHHVQVTGVDVDLTPTEFRLLEALIEHPGQALTHAQLLTLVWGDGFRQRDEVKLYVSYLRRKLQQAAGVDPVETVRGVGYRYAPRYSQVDDSKSLAKQA